MKHTIQRIKVVFVIGIIALMLFINKSVSVYASDNIIANGVCGDNLIWELTDDGVMTISGSGSMTNYSNYPWESYNSQIKSVVFEEGIKSSPDLCVKCL